MSYSEDELERARQEEREAIAKFITDQGVPIPMWLEMYMEVKNNERKIAGANNDLSTRPTQS